MGVNDVNSVGQQEPTLRIGGIKFLENEVLGINKRPTKNKNINIFIVETTFGRFEYVGHKGVRESSIMGGKLSNVSIDKYEGTKDQDMLFLENSGIARVDTKDGNKDIFYLDYYSDIGFADINLDSCDEVWHRVY